MNETINSLKQRRSIRSFKQGPVKQEELAAILEAGTYAASGSNKQTALLIAVENPDVIRKLEILNASFTPNKEGTPFYGAKTIVLVLADRSAPNNIKDGSLCMGNLMNAAYSLGVGSCWINRAYESFETDEGKALLKEWGIEGDYVGVGVCILGYPEGPHPAAAPRKENYIYRIK